MDRLLDETRSGSFYLRQPAIADMVVEAIYYNSSVLGHYLLHALVVMPNHVHLLCSPAVELQKLTRSLKGITAKRANALLALTGKPFWQEESYDRLVRNGVEFDKIRSYIEQNPVRAGLVRFASEYRWSSAAGATGGSLAAMGSAAQCKKDTYSIVKDRMLSSGKELSSRERAILHSVVRSYIDTGEPVGSRTISRMRTLALSPATIRNVMADLADDGYLAQPHTSAGRIPTGKAFRDFAGAVPTRPLPAADRDHILKEMQSGESLEERVGIASRVLTEITRNVGIAAALPSSTQELEHLELIALSERRVLMIVATRDRMVRNKVITLDRAMTQDDLIQLRNYVNANFAGWTLEKARAELLRRIEEERAMYDAVLQQLTLLYQKGLLRADPDPQLAMDGASWLVGLDLHLTRERMRDLFRALEEKKHVVALLDRFLDASQGRVGIHVGLADAHPAMSDLTLIGVTIDLPSGLRTRIAVLGPMRMQYEKVISTVLQIGRTFETLQS